MRTVAVAVAVSVLFSASLARADLKRPFALNCSTFLTQPIQLKNLFVFGKHSGSETYVWDQMASAPQRVSLTHNFADVEMVSDMVEPLAAGLKGYPAHVVAAAGKQEWTTRKEDLLFSINYGIMRGPMFSPPPRGQVSYLEHLESYGGIDGLLLEPLKAIIAPLYDSYANQGPERAQLLPQVRQQDEMEATRYTRFVLSRFVKPMAYAQVLVSKNPSEPLHVQQTWGRAVADMVRTQPDEVVGELGRLHLIHPNEYQFDDHRRLVDPVTREASLLKTNRKVTFLLLQKIMAWTNSDARLDRLLIQVNLKVEKIMQMNGVPLHLGQRRELNKTWPSGDTVTEVVYAFDRQALLRVEDVLMAQTLTAWLKSVQGQPFFQSAPDGRLGLSFYANELSVLKRFGFYEKLFPEKPPMPLDIDGDGTLMYIGIDMIDKALAILEPYLK